MRWFSLFWIYLTLLRAAETLFYSFAPDRPMRRYPIKLFMSFWLFNFQLMLLMSTFHSTLASFLMGCWCGSVICWWQEGRHTQSKVELSAKSGEDRNRKTFTLVGSNTQHRAHATKARSMISLRWMDVNNINIRDDERRKMSHSFDISKIFLSHFFFITSPLDRASQSRSENVRGKKTNRKR